MPDMRKTIGLYSCLLWALYMDYLDAKIVLL